MERINQFKLFELGKQLQALATYSPEKPPGELFGPLLDAMAAMHGVVEGKPIPLGISKASAVEFVALIDELWNKTFFTTNDDGTQEFNGNGSQVAGFVWHRLRQAHVKFETVLGEEMREAATYYVPRRGIFYTPSLVDEAEASFPIEIVAHIPDKAKLEWRAAGRCLAFNLLSASGFHVARAVEATLEAYYQLFCSKPSGTTLHGWYDYHKELVAIPSTSTPRPSERTLAELDQMREDYRNPIMHPRVTLSEADARMLFANGESLIIAMAQDIAEAIKGVQPSLALVPAATGAP